MSYLRYVCLFMYSGVQHILCWIFILLVFIWYFLYPISPVSLDCPFFIVPLVSLMYIYYRKEIY